MAYDPATTLRRARKYVADRSGNPDQLAETVAFLAMALTLAISQSGDPDAAESVALEAGNFVELEQRTQPEPEFTPRG